MRPLLFNHIQKVPVVHNPVKNRTQCEPIMSTERGGETDDRHTVLGGSHRRVQSFAFGAFDSMRVLDARVELRKDLAIGGSSGMVCLIYDNSIQPCRIKLL